MTNHTELLDEQIRAEYEKRFGAPKPPVEPSDLPSLPATEVKTADEPVQEPKLEVPDDLPALRPAKSFRHSERLRIIGTIQEIQDGFEGREEGNDDVSAIADTVEAVEDALIAVAVDQDEMLQWMNDNELEHVIAGLAAVAQILGEGTVSKN